MKKECVIIQEKITSGERLQAEEMSHVLSCPDCALFQKLSALPEVTEKEIPSVLDASILAYAHAKCQKTTPHPGRFLRVLLPAAAALFLCAGALFYMMPAKKTPQTLSVPQAGDVWSPDAEDKLFTLGCEVGTGIACIDSSLEMI